MKKSFLALKNKNIKTFIEESNVFEISTGPKEQHDILFCDTLSLGKTIKAKTKVYIASNFFESLDNIGAYDDYDYFLGFGNKIYDYISNEFGLEPSKVFNGFVYVEKIEEKYNEEKPESLMSFSSVKMDKNNKESIYQKKLFDDMLFILLDQIENPQYIYRDFKIGISETSKVEEIPNYIYNNSKINYFTTFFNCRMYFGQGGLVIPSAGAVSILHHIKQIKSQYFHQCRPHFNLFPFCKKEEKSDMNLISRFYKNCIVNHVDIKNVYQQETLYNREILNITNDRKIPDISGEFLETLKKIESSI